MTDMNFSGEIRMISDQLFREYLVMPSGQIKTAYWERNVASPLLHVEFQRHQGRVVRVLSVRLSSSLGEGWSLLRDLYEAEGRSVDYETFLLYQEQARKRGIETPIDDAYLPDEVLRRRASWFIEQRRLELPPPQRKALAEMREDLGVPESAPVKKGKARRAQ